MLNISIKNTNMDLTLDQQNYVKSKMAKVENYIGSDDINLFYEVEMDTSAQSGDIYRAEARMQIGQDSFYADARGRTIESAIDQVKDKFFRELRKTKTKKTNAFIKGAQRIKRMLRGE